MISTQSEFTPGPIPEEFITRSVVRWLSTDLWRVVGVSMPAGGTGIRLRPDDAALPAARNVIIPDVAAVASEHGLALVIESKPRVSVSDAKKLNLLKRDPRFAAAVWENLGVAQDHLITGIAFGPLTGADRTHLESASLMVDICIEVTTTGMAMVTFSPRSQLLDLFI